MTSIIEEVRNKIKTLKLSLNYAAKEIGVTSGSLEKHLSGGYIRSDSLAKYRYWIDKHCNPKKTNEVEAPNKVTEIAEVQKERDHSFSSIKLFEGDIPPCRPFNVVDLFSGCGGMSLGFDLFQNGGLYQTVLAMDIEEPMVTCYNDNHKKIGQLSGTTCRKLNLAEFQSESEILAFYLDHFCIRTKDKTLRKELNALPLGGLNKFKSLILDADAQFIKEFESIRNGSSFAPYYTKKIMESLGQTAVTGFLNTLRLPQISSRKPSLGPLVWANFEDEVFEKVTCSVPTEDAFVKRCKKAAVDLKDKWNLELSNLESKANGKGRGQLASSAGKIRDFIEFVQSPPMKSIKAAWIKWLSLRTALREYFFDDPRMINKLKAVYRDERKVDVVLGGPPCQGFSRIGRGKIRSLRESGVHVQEDSEAGDQRNLLLYKYVMFVGALAPKTFLFENVSHFQSEVKTPEGTFLASEILAEAIKDISNEHVEYAVASKIISCSEHLIPQARQRFFMVGVRNDLLFQSHIHDVPAWVISLPIRKEVPLLSALEGLPEPFYAGRDETSPVDLSRKVYCATTGTFSNCHESSYYSWIRQPAPDDPENSKFNVSVDSHYARRPRRDDEDFFRLMGPGKRWMDYRCDESQTLNDIAEAIALLKDFISLAEHSKSKDLSKLLARLDKKVIDRVERSIDGSLSLRLLLETIKPHQGELHHHLATSSYLEKKNGNHGDWLSRLDASKPSKTIVSHMAKDTYAYVHPLVPRTLSVREAARVQTFPDWFSFSSLGLVDAYRVVGNAVPPLLSNQLAEKVAQILWVYEERSAKCNKQMKM